MKYSLPSIAWCFTLLLLAFVGGEARDASADAPLPTEYVSVTDFGNFFTPMSERIEQAIAAAAATEHKTVFFPNGTYALRGTISLNVGADSEIHLIGESRDGVLLVPDEAYLEANYNGGDWENGGDRIAHMINLQSGSVFNSVDVSIQNMTVDMQDQLVMGESVETYNTVGHGIRVGQGWQTGQFLVNEVTVRNTNSYGIGIQDRDGHPKNNITLTNLNIERTGSDGIDTKEASGDGNRNLVIRNVNINEVGFLDTGAAPAIDIRYRDAVIENVNLVSQASRSTLPGQTSSTTGIVFRPVDNVDGGVIQATVSDVYIRGFNNGIQVSASETAQHNNIAISDFRIQGQQNTGIGVGGNNHSGHTISDGFVDPAFGGAAVNANGQATVTNVAASRWDPALTPTTDTTLEGNVSLAGETFSPAWEGIVGSEQVSLNPTAGAGPFVFDVGPTGVLQVDFDAVYNAMDRLIIDGTLNLDGELVVNPIDGTQTTAGTFQVFDADAITGSFDTITLPTAGPGLTWNTDNLAIDGTISLLQSPFIFYGDTNTSYNAGSPDDNPPIDSAFAADVQTVSANWTFKGLDEVGNNDVRAMTFSLDPLDANDLDSVTIEARVQGLSGYENDSMALDLVGNNRRLDSMTGFTTGGGWMTLQYELDPNEFSLLSDGQLNLAFFDDTRVDWVELSWILSNEPGGLPGDLDGDNDVDGFDFLAWQRNPGIDDLSDWEANYGTAIIANAMTVPEPSALTLMVIGLAVTSLRRQG